MHSRFASIHAALALMLLTAAAPAAKRRQTPPPLILPDVVRVAMTTDLGVITLDLDAKRALITTRNFVRYTQEKRFDGTVFYRVMRLAWGAQSNGLIQGGIQSSPSRALPPIAHEPTDTTGIRHTAGAISMARNAPGTARGDFSILLSDLDGLNADPTANEPDTRAGFTAFGQVVEGMDAVRKIYEVPLSPTLGQGFMKGQMIAKPVRIISVRRIAILPSAPIQQSAKLNRQSESGQPVP